MTGKEFKILVQSARLKPNELANVLEISREHVYKLYKEEIVKSLYVDRVKGHINGKGGACSEENELLKKENELLRAQNATLLQSNEALLESIRNFKHDFKELKDMVTENKGLIINNKPLTSEAKKQGG